MPRLIDIFSQNCCRVSLSVTRKIMDRESACKPLPARDPEIVRSAQFKLCWTHIHQLNDSARHAQDAIYTYCLPWDDPEWVTSFTLLPRLEDVITLANARIQQSICTLIKYYDDLVMSCLPTEKFPWPDHIAGSYQFQFRRDFITAPALPPNCATLSNQRAAELLAESTTRAAGLCTEAVAELSQRFRSKLGNLIAKMHQDQSGRVYTVLLAGIKRDMEILPILAQATGASQEVARAVKIMGLTLPTIIPEDIRTDHRLRKFLIQKTEEATAELNTL